jgi:hypothetical protein
MTTNGPSRCTDGLNDGLVESQWFDRVSASTDVPERRLLLAVLVDAVRCLQGGNVKERWEAAAWVRGENGNARLSFRSLCDGLGLEELPVARRLLEVTGNDGWLLGRRRVRYPSPLHVMRPKARKPRHTVANALTHQRQAG